MEYQIPLARGNSGFCLRSKFAVVRLHSTGPISRGRWSSAGALRRRFAAVRFCLASPDMPLRPRWRGKSLVRTRCRVQFPGAAPICPVSIAGDAAVLYTDDTAFDSPTGLQFCRESIDGDAPDSYSGKDASSSSRGSNFGFLSQWQTSGPLNRPRKFDSFRTHQPWRVNRTGSELLC